jgi:Inactive homolog of metal-dependent proteases, putative molecular chaperone
MRLGIQTAGFAHAVVVDDGSQINVRPLGRAIAEDMPGLVADLLAQASGSFQDVTQIRVCVGPGGFTSLRSGLAYGQGLSRALGIPLEATSLFHLAMNNAGEFDGQLLGFSQGGADVILARPSADGFLDEPHLVAEEPAGLSVINDWPGLEPKAFFHGPCPNLQAKPLYVRPPDATPATRPPWLR